MIDVFFNGEKVTPFQGINLPKIIVDRSKDKDPNNPTPTIIEMRVENNTNHVLKNLMLDTNLPSDTYDLSGLPEEIEEGGIAKFKLFFYAKRALDNSEFPESIYMNIKGNEALVRS